MHNKIRKSFTSCEFGLIVVLLAGFTVSVIECRLISCEIFHSYPEECFLKNHGTFETHDVTSINKYSRTSYKRFDLENWGIVKRVPTFLFEKLPKLRYVVIMRSAITEIQPGDFWWTKKAVELMIIYNPIVYIHDYAFFGSNRTRQLIMSHNQLSNITRNTFNGLTKIRGIDLSHNQITHIEDGAFNFRLLVALNLANNKLKVISRKTIVNISPMTEFSIASNAITRINDLFDGMTALQFLDLNNNPIVDLNYTMFARMPDLRNLGIALTGFLSSTDEDVANAEAAQSGLEKLALSDNQLEHTFLSNVHRVFKQLGLSQEIKVL